MAVPSPLGRVLWIRFPRLWLEHLGFDALTCEHRLQPVRRLEPVAGRIRGVDGHILRQQVPRLTAHGTPLGVGAGHVRLDQPRRQEHRLRSRAEQAGLSRGCDAGRARAACHDDQREKRGATHESSGWSRENSQAIGGRVRGRPPRRQCTVIVAWPVLPSLVALKTALPTAPGWTSTSAPEPLTLMIELSLADQETDRLVSKLPAASRRSARNVTPLSPTARSAVLGTTVTVATGAGAATLMLASPVFPSLVARSEARPAARARIVAEGPFTLVISTIEASVLDHDTDRLLRMLPAASRSCAVNVALSPPVRLALPGTTVTVATGFARPTVIVACPVLPWLVANTVAIPGARPSA